MARNVPKTNLFFIVGPLRTGSSLMSRCIDDHPEAICLCESEINRALFEDYFIKLHYRRMWAHGFSFEDFLSFIDRKKQNDTLSFHQWFEQVFPKAKILYNKPQAHIIGDKSPDIYRSKELIKWMALKHPLIYTVRDPRAILRSIDVQADAPQRDKDIRWQTLIDNFIAWEAYLNQSNVLVTKYEDLVEFPEQTMELVYEHLELPYSPRFLEPFERLYPQRFLWKTAINWQTGVREDFDKMRAVIKNNDLTDKQLDLIYSNQVIQRFMQRFGYK